MSAANVSQALNGAPAGRGFICQCPCTGHGRGRGDLRPSLSVADGDDALLVKCFSGCDPRDVLDELRRRGLLDESSRRREIVETSRRRDVVKMGDVGTSPIHSLPRRRQDVEPDPKAMQLWQSSGPAAGTRVERYLRRRGFAEWPTSLRYSPVVGGMVVPVQALSRQLIAVQATHLQEDGRKAPGDDCRRTYGALGSGAVRLGPAGAVLGIAEGVESALSAQIISGVPVWASLGAARMHGVAVPDRVRELHIFGDDDEAGRAAAERTAEAHKHRRVIIHYPPDGIEDWNDWLLVQRAVSA